MSRATLHVPSMSLILANSENLKRATKFGERRENVSRRQQKHFLSPQLGGNVLASQVFPPGKHAEYNVACNMSPSLAHSNAAFCSPSH